MRSASSSQIGKRWPRHRCGGRVAAEARILLQLALAFTEDVQQIRYYFTTIGSVEFDEVGNRPIALSCRTPIDGLRFHLQMVA